MAIVLNDNLQIESNKPIDARYYINQRPYLDFTEVFTELPLFKRYIGQIVNIANVEYVFKNGTADVDLVVNSELVSLTTIIILSQQYTRIESQWYLQLVSQWDIQLQAQWYIQLQAQYYIQLQAQSYIEIEAQSYIKLKSLLGNFVNLSTQNLSTEQFVLFPNNSGTIALTSDLIKIKAISAPSFSIPSESAFRNFVEANQDNLLALSRAYTIDGSGNGNFVIRIHDNINQIIVNKATVVNNVITNTVNDAYFTINENGLTFRNRKLVAGNIFDVTFNASTLTSNLTLTIPNTGINTQNLITEKFGLFTNYIRIGANTAVSAVTAANGGLKLQGNNLEYSDGTNYNRIEREKNIVSKSGAVTLLITEYIILCTAACTLILPAASIGKTFIIYSDNNALQVNAGAGTTVDGLAAVSFTGYKKLEIRCLTATKWLTN